MQKIFRGSTHMSCTFETIFGGYLAVLLGTSLVYKQQKYFGQRKKFEIQIINVLWIRLTEYSKAKESSKVKYVLIKYLNMF